jgi:glyoxylase I family protein
MTDLAGPAAPGPGQRRMRLAGLHHITLICRDLTRTTAFYRDLLGLALVREATNDDDPGSRHFWFGDEHGSPGTLVSFLEYPSMAPGAVGVGSTHHFAFSVESADEQVAWREYLGAHGVPCSEILDRGGLRSLYLRDPDGHIIEIATDDAHSRGGPAGRPARSRRAGRRDRIGRQAS